MKRVIIGIAIVLAFIVVIVAGARIFTPEDAWICSQIGWEKHGKPLASAPDKLCVAGKIFEKPTTVKINVYFNNTQFNPNAADCSLAFPVERVVSASDDIIFSALNNLFAGPTEMEKAQGYQSFFSPDTKSFLKQVKIEDSVAYVDLADFRRILNNVSASCAGAQFMAEMDKTVKSANPNIQKIIYSIDDEPSTFYEFMQIGCYEGNNFCNSPFSKVQVTPKSSLK